MLKICTIRWSGIRLTARAILLLLFVGGTAVRAEDLPLLTLSSPGRFKPSSIQVFVDESGSRSFDEIKKETFTTVAGNGYSGGLTSAAVWLRFKLENRSDIRFWLIRNEFPLIESFECFLVDPGQVHIVTGAAIPYDQRPYRSRVLSIPADIVGTPTVYLRYQSITSVRVGVRIEDEKTSLQSEWVAIMIHAIYVGAIGSISLMALCIWFLERTQTFFFFAASALTGTSFVISQEGFLLQHVFTTHPYAGILFNFAVAPIFNAATMEFTRRFMDLETIAPRWNNFCKAYAIVGVAWSLVGLLFPRIGNPGNVLISVLMVIFLVPGLVFAMRRGQRAAYYFAFSWAFLSLGAVPYILKVTGLMFTDLSEIGFRMGGLVYTMVLGAGLADRLRSATTERVKMETLIAERSQFFAMMSHEIRTPLNGVVGTTDLLASGPLTEKQATYVRIIQESSRILLRIINDILDFSRLQSTSLRLDLRPCRPRDLLTDVSAILSPLLANRAVKLAVTVDPALTEFILADELRIRQVLLNLGNNAVKFTDRGRIDFDVKQIGETGGRLILRFSVSDTGSGIAPEKQEHLFQPFVQVDQSQRRHAGTGLGLPISQQIVRKMGGRIELESKPGSGSVFYFEIEVPRAEAPIVRSSARPEAQRAELHVLVAEDNEINRKVAEAVLHSLGVRVELVEHGELAIQAMRARKFDIVFLDLQMPVMDGIEAATRIRQEFAGTHIVVLTADAGTTVLEDGLADDLILKPIRVDIVARALDVYISKKMDRMQ